MLDEINELFPEFKDNENNEKLVNLSGNETKPIIVDNPRIIESSKKLSNEEIRENVLF